MNGPSQEEREAELKQLRERAEVAEEGNRTLLRLNRDVKQQLDDRSREAQEASELRISLRDALARERSVRDRLERTAERCQELEARLSATEGRLLARLQEDIAETQAESARLLHLIDVVQSSRFWSFKRFFERLTGTRRTRRDSG